MALDDIFKKIEADFAVERDALLDRARREAETISFESRRKIDQLIAEEKARYDRELASSVMQCRMRAEFEKKKTLGRAKVEDVNKATEVVKKKLQGVPTSANYSNIFATLADEVLDDGADQDTIVYVLERDVELAKTALKKHALGGCQIKIDNSCLGGIRVELDGGRIVYDNTIFSRFTKAAVVLRPQVIEALFDA